MDVQLLGDHVLVQLLPDRRGVELVGLDDAVDGPMNATVEEVLDLHDWVASGTSRNAR
jgi:hypothetical protein